VAIVTLRPLVGTDPEKVTAPDAGAATDAPVRAPMSMPRCCPPAYGWLESNVKPTRTGPCTGQLQASAAGADSRNSGTTRRSRRRTGITSVVEIENGESASS
jgi:hypothetical protein